MGSLGSLRDVAGLCVLLALSCLTLRGADFAAVYNLKTYGAAGTGQTLDTAAIQKAIEELPEEQREVFYGHEVLGYSFKEMAEMTDSLRLVAEEFLVLRKIFSISLKLF